MEKYTRTLLFIITVINCTSVQAQPRIGMKVGLITSGVKAEYSNTFQDYTRKSKAGFLFGVMVNCPLGKNFALRPGAELVVKGSRERHRGNYFIGGGNYDFIVNQPLTYIDIPINILYSVNSGKGKLLIGGGPVVSFGLNSNYSGYHTLKQFDPGINIQAAYEWPIGFSLNLNHTRSLQNISSDKQYFDHFRNYYYGLTLGYIF